VAASSVCGPLSMKACGGRNKQRGMDATYFFVGLVMSQINASCDPHVHQLAIRLARKCRHVIDAVLRDEEKGEADRSFYEIIRLGLEDFQKGEKR
jgi:hypothetical protein